MVVLAAACAEARLTPPDPEPDPPSAPLPATVTILPASDTMLIGDSQTLSAAIRDSAGNTITGLLVSWYSSDTSVAIAPAAYPGLIVARGAGNATIHASIGGVTGTAIMAVAPALQLEDSLPSMLVGESLAIDVSARDRTGAPVPVPVSSWSSSDPSVVAVGTGTVHALAPGVATLTASSVNSSVSVTVAVLATRVNREIAFLHVEYPAATQRQLRILAPPSSGEAPITPLLHSLVGFGWSPDGARMAIELRPVTGVQPRGIWVYEADGSGARQVTATGGTAAWSPDGTRLAYVDTVAGDPEIFVNTVAGDQPRRLTFNAGSDTYPAWSPDGQWILFVRTDRTIQAIRPDGTGERLITGGGNITQGGPVISPDGRRLAYVAHAGMQQSMYVSSTVPGSPARRSSIDCVDEVCNPAQPVFYPLIWSRDGRSIYYHHFNNGQIPIIRTEVAARRHRVLPVSALNCWPDDLSPDGVRLAVHCSAASEGAEIRTFDVNDTLPRTVRLVPDSAANARWRP